MSGAPERGSEFDAPLEWCRSKRSAKWHRVGEDVIPAWIAETDYTICPAVSDAISLLLEHGDVGYPDWTGEPLAGPFAERMSSRYGWSPDPGNVRHVTDLIQALQVVVELCTRPGDAVALHVPNYPPFLSSLSRMTRRIAASPMCPEASSWSFDADLLDARIGQTAAKVLLVVNPHNPTGRVFTTEELEQVADIACRHDLTVVSDELHAELLHDGRRHVPFASLGPEIEARTVTITSATKSFNLGGLRTAVAHVGHAGVRAAWDRLPADFIGGLNVVGVEATLAAWRDGDGWLARQQRYLEGQRDHLAVRLGELPGITFRPPQATYLAWLDCRMATLDEDPAEYFRSNARVELAAGPLFGEGGEGHARLNFGTSRAILDEIVDRMRACLPTLQ